MITDLKDRAVLVKFTDRCWMGGKIDSEVSAKVHKDAGAKADTGHYWKRLVPKAAIRPRANAGNAVREFHMNQTLPWMEGGVRILPVANFKKYTDGMRKLIAKAEEEEKKFIKEYPEWVKEAKKTHGKLFNEAHFPTASEVRAKFGIDFDIIPLPNVADWRVNLDKAQVDELKRAATAKFEEVLKDGVRELYERIGDQLKHINESLSDPDKVFRDSLIKNLQELLDIVGTLNVGGDKGLDDVAKALRTKFKDVKPQELREDGEKRSKAAKDAREIMKKMQGLVKEL